VSDAAPAHEAVSAPPRAQADTSSFASRLVRGQAQAVGVLIILGAIIIYTGLHNGLFWGLNDLKVQAENMSFIAIAAVGTALLIITGNIDLSIGSVLGLCAVVAGMLSSVVPVPIAFVLAILLGGAIGAINGMIVWNVSSSPIIITLGGLTLIRGIVVVITKGEAVQNIPASFSNFGNLTPLGVPMPVWAMLVVGAGGFLFLTLTTTGRHIYAIGGNKEAARAAGIRVRRITIGVFIVSGLLVGLAAILQASLFGAPDDTFGVGFELQVITAVIVGGVSFAGGEGGILRALLGCALLQAVNGSVVFLGIFPSWADIITGAILIVAVSLDQIVHRQRERYQKAMAMRDLARFEEERRMLGERAALEDPSVVTIPTD
jgi:ribose/xylose/arabinose/galactoside ABC-type transport system permease subunit